jgi:hypothetical protein
LIVAEVPQEPAASHLHLLVAITADKNLNSDSHEDSREHRSDHRRCIQHHGVNRGLIRSDSVDITTCSDYSIVASNCRKINNELERT